MQIPLKRTLNSHIISLFMDLYLYMYISNYGNLLAMHILECISLAA